MKRIFLIGYMGAGKTTVGKDLAKRMGLSFIDLDCYIEGSGRYLLKKGRRLSVILNGGCSTKWPCLKMY